MPASHFDVNSMTGRPKFIVRHSTTTLFREFWGTQYNFEINCTVAAINLETPRFFNCKLFVTLTMLLTY
jgi:hypothetical protein